MNPVLRRMRPLLGTYVEMVIAESTALNDAAMQAGFDAITEVHERLGFQSVSSDLTRINQGWGQWVSVHPLSLRVLRLAFGMMEASEGLFDCTIGGALVHAGALPDHGGEALPRGRLDDIEWCRRAVRLRRPIKITLDGIAKGYAVDRAVRVLQQHGVTAGWVNAGGDLRAFGSVIVPVSRREVGGELRPIGGLQSAAMASSGTGGQRDERFPAQLVTATGGVQHAGISTVLARTAWRADALTKVAAQLPEAVRASRIRQLGGQWLP